MKEKIDPYGLSNAMTEMVDHHRSMWLWKGSIRLSEERQSETQKNFMVAKNQTVELEGESGSTNGKRKIDWLPINGPEKQKVSEFYHSR